MFDVGYNHKDIIRGINKSLLYDRSKKCKSLYETVMPHKNNQIYT